MSWRQLALEPRKKLQRAFSRRFDEKHHTSLLNTLDAEDRARLRSCGGPLASARQLASPSNPAEKLEDADYETTARALPGQDLPQPTPHR